jgi:hypothetical protein
MMKRKGGHLETSLNMGQKRTYCCALPSHIFNGSLVYNYCIYLDEYGKARTHLMGTEYGRSELAIVSALIEHQRAEK